MTENYNRILERIAKSANLEKEEIEKRIDAKREKLSGLISKEGAAQIIASELGISFEDEKLKINELIPGMRKVNTTGKVLNISPIRSFKTKNDKESKVVNIWIADDSSNIRAVLWDTNHVELIEKEEIKEEVVIEIKNATMRDNELHLGSFSEIKLSQEKIPEVVTEKVFKEKKISELNKGEVVKIRAFVVQAFDPRFFNSCSECGKKAHEEGNEFKCNNHGKVIPEKKAILNIVLDDGNETIRAVLFHEVIGKIGINDFNDADNFEKQKQSILGKELIFSGNVQLNNYFNNLEIIIDDIQEIDLDKTIEELEK